jgi:methylmalonyl-CoA mutase, N-terminal domain
LRDRYGAKNPRSMQLRFHTQTAGVSLTAQQPEVNIARVAIEALAGVLSGTQSLHTDSFDEALALPTEKAARVALRTQQVIAQETGAASVADPLGGSWFVEELTDEMERQAEAIFAHVQDLGGGSMLEGTYIGIEQGWFQGEIAEAAYQFERKLATGRRVLVGANAFTEGDDDRPTILSIDPVVEDVQLKRLAEVKRDRDEGAVAAALNRVRKEAAETDTNLMPAFIDAVGVYATIGELTAALADVFGRWTETPSI